MAFPVVALFSLVLVSHKAAGQSSRADSIAATAAVDDFHAALAAGDSSRAVARLAEDVLIIEAGGIQTRAEYLGGHLGADIKASQGRKEDRTVVRVTVIGDVAYIVSRTITPPAPAPSGAAPSGNGSESAELMVVAKSGGMWKIRAVHWSSRRRR